MTCQKYFCLKCWRCSGLLRALKAGRALRGWGWDTGTDCTVRSLLPMGLASVHLLLAGSTQSWAGSCGGAAVSVLLWLLSALCPEGWAPPSCASPEFCVSHWNTCVLPCSLQQGLLLNEYWMSTMSSVPHCVQAGVAGLWEVTVEATDSCACVPGDCWK